MECAQELQQRFTKKRNDEDASQERIKEYSSKKTDRTIYLIKRAISKGFRFRYGLADS